MKERKTRISGLISANLVLVLLALPLVVLGAVGDLDTTFDSDGLVTTAIGTGLDMGGAVVIQSDGKIVVAGVSHNGTNNDFALVRYNTDGSLDTTFGTNGLVTTDLGGIDTGSAVALQADGKILLVGQSNSPGDFDFTVVRYNTDGSLDATFDTDGIVTTNVDILHDRAYAVAVQSDGKIVVAGYGRIAPSTPVNNDIVVMRYNADGSLDTGFDGDGIAIASIGGSQDQAYDIAVQADGKIVVIGYSNGNGTDYDFVVLRYNTDGSLDTGFDTDGIVTTGVGGDDDFAYGVAIQADGKIVVSGYSHNGSNYDLAVARYNTDGSLDTSFDTDGTLVTDIAVNDDYGMGVAIDSAGNIVVVGYTQNATDQDFLVTRYTSDGALDTSFSDDGIVTTVFGASHDRCSDVAIQADGKIVAAGSSTDGSNYDFAVARYFGEAIPLAPVAVDDQGVDFTTNEDTAFTTGNVLDNDYDPDLSGSLSVDSFDDSGLLGTLTSNGDGTFDYDPLGNFEYLLPGENEEEVFGYVVSDGVLTDTAVVTITVTGVNDLPVVNAGVDQEGDEGDSFNFSGSFDDPDWPTSDASLDMSMEAMVWDFGDGITVMDTLTPTHTYVDNGYFTVTLTITDTYGGMGQDSLLVTVNNVAPVVSAGPDVSLMPGETFTQTGSFADPGADTWEATVDYGSGASSLTLVGNTFSLTQTYPVAGVYTVTVTVEDDDGGVGTDEVRVSVQAPLFKVYFPWFMHKAVIKP